VKDPITGETAPALERQAANIRCDRETTACKPHRTPFQLEKAHSIGGVEFAGFAEPALAGVFLSVIAIISRRASLFRR
jgi:hypothetical protein